MASTAWSGGSEQHRGQYRENFPVLRPIACLEQKDDLPGRGRLCLRAANAVRAGRISLRSPFAAERIRRTSDGLIVKAREDYQPDTLEVGPAGGRNDVN